MRSNRWNSFILFCIFFGFSSSIAAEEINYKSIEKKMKQVNWLIGHGKTKKALTLIETSKHLGGESLCSLEALDLYPRSPEPEQEKPPININILFRYFADLGVVFRRHGRFDDAARCIRNGSSFANNPREVRSVLVEAARIVPSLDFTGLKILTDVPNEESYNPDICADTAFVTLAGAWEYEKVSTALQALPPEVFALIKHNPVQPTQIPPDKRAYALKQYQRILGAHFRRQANALYRSPTSVGGQYLSSGHGVKTFESRTLAVRSLRRKNDRWCTKKNRESCVRLALTFKKLKANAGRFELAVATEWEGGEGACESDEGIAYLFFSPHDSDKTQVVRIADVHVNSTCGSGGWGDWGEARVLAFASDTNTIKVGTSGGSLISKNCWGGDLVFSNVGRNLICAADSENQLYCVGWNYREVANRHQTFPELNLKNGFVHPNIRNVDETLWGPLLNQLSGNIVDISKALPSIQKDARSRIADRNLKIR